MRGTRFGGSRVHNGPLVDTCKVRDGEVRLLTEMADETDRVCRMRVWRGIPSDPGRGVYGRASASNGRGASTLTACGRGTRWAPAWQTQSVLEDLEKRLVMRFSAVKTGQYHCGAARSGRCQRTDCAHQRFAAHHCMRTLAPIRPTAGATRFARGVRHSRVSQRNSKCFTTRPELPDGGDRIDPRHTRTPCRARPVSILTKTDTL